MLLPLILSALPQVVADPAADAPRPARIRIPAAELAELDPATERQLDLDVIFRDPANGDVLALAEPAERARLVAAGVRHDVVHADERAFYAERLASGAQAAVGAPPLGAGLTPPFGSGSMGGYYTFNQIVSVIDQLRATYPNIVSDKLSLGKTLQNRDLWAFKISDNPGVDENEPEVRFDSLHHAREPQGMQTSLFFALYLLENYGTDSLATYLVDERETWFVLCVNPDGYVYNQQTDPGGGGLWRKNRRNNGGGSFGVDLNRNYPFQWGFDNTGSSPNSTSETYRGTSPASEPETQAMIQFIQARDFESALSVHTFSNLWLHPYGYDLVLPPNIAEYIELSNLATETNGYEVGSPPQILYTANGGTIDYDEATKGTLSWTPEIGGQGDGFWPIQARIVPLAVENLLAFQRTALAGGAFVRTVDIAVADAGDGDGDYEPGERVEFSVSLRNSGAVVTAGPVTVSLALGSPEASVVGSSALLGTLGSFADATTPSGSLSLDISTGAADGAAIPYVLTVSYDGFNQEFDGAIAVGEARQLLADNLSNDFGWTAGLPGDTAQTGLWERAVPIGTSNNGEPLAPGSDATPGPGGVAFVTGNGGGSAGNDDVDDGLTTLISPRIDLSDFPSAAVGYSRWFGLQSQLDDTFEISVSNDDGASWVPLESVTGNQNSWTPISIPLASVIAPTDAVRLRFIAEDDPNNSLVEAAIDQLRIDGFGSSPKLLRYGSAQVGDSVGLSLSGEPSALMLLYVSPQSGSLVLPGLLGTIELNVANIKLVSQNNLPGSGLGLLDAPIPSNPGLAGLTYFLQAIQVAGGTLELTNGIALTFE